MKPADKWIRGEYNEDGQPILPEDIPDHVWYVIQPSSHVTSWEYALTCGPSSQIPLLVRTHCSYRKERAKEKGEEYEPSIWFWSPIEDEPPSIPKEFRRYDDT